jgi:hypothetical protein
MVSRAAGRPVSVQNVGEQAGRVGRPVSVWKAGGRVDWSGGVLRARWTDDRQEDHTRQTGGRLAGEKNCVGRMCCTATNGCSAAWRAAAVQRLQMRPATQAGVDWRQTEQSA